MHTCTAHTIDARSIMGLPSTRSASLISLESYLCDCKTSMMLECKSQPCLGELGLHMKKEATSTLCYNHWHS